MRLLGKGNGAPNAGEGGGRDPEPPLQPQPALPRRPPVCLHYSSGSGLVSPGLFGPRAVPRAAPRLLFASLPLVLPFPVAAACAGNCPFAISSASHVLAEL